MKIVNRRLEKTADESAARNSAFPELRKLLCLVVILAVAIYLSIGLVVDIIVAGISFETETRLFSTFSPKIFASKLGEIDDDDERLHNVRVILDKFVALPDTPPLNYRLIIIHTEQPNAFAFPGGTIGVTEGLLKALKEDIELAFVLGHEIGHFHNRDHLRGLGRAIGVSLAYAVVFGGDLGNNNLGGLFRYVMDRGYSRKQETKADQFGVLLVQQAYGETEGIERLFEILEKSKDLPEWTYMLSTHPSPGDRIAKLNSYARKLPMTKGPGQ